MHNRAEATIGAGATEAGYRAGAPMTRMQAAVFWAHKVVTTGILITGTYFNVTALFFGMDLVASTFFTTPGEIVLTTMFFTGFVLGVLAERYVAAAPRWRRVVRRMMTVYMLALTLVHGVNNLLLHNQQGYAEVFSGPFYTYPAIVILGALAIVIATTSSPSGPNAVRNTEFSPLDR